MRLLKMLEPEMGGLGFFGIFVVVIEDYKGALNLRRRSGILPLTAYITSCTTAREGGSVGNAGAFPDHKTDPRRGKLRGPTG